MHHAGGISNVHPRHTREWRSDQQQLVTLRGDWRIQASLNKLPFSFLVSQITNLLFLIIPFLLKIFVYSVFYFVSFRYIRSALELESCNDKSRPRGARTSQKKKRGTCLSFEQKEEELLPDLKPKAGTELRLTELPHLHYPEGATPADITKHSLDSSYTLDLLLKKLKQ